MAEYIDREELEVELNHRLNFLMGENGEYDHYTSGFDEAVTRVENFPAADVAPVRHGRWLGWGKSGTPTYENYGTCSVCGEDAEIYTEHRNYCPNCGARMDLEET